MKNAILTFNQRLSWLVTLVVVLLTITQLSAQEIPNPNPPQCADVMPWTNFYPNGFPSNYVDFVTLCPDYNRVKLGRSNHAKLTVGVGNLTGSQITSYKLTWTSNFRYFKSISVDNNTALKWTSPGLLGFDQEGNPILGWSHGIVQDETYGLKFLRSQDDFEANQGFSSFGIKNDGDVEVIDADFHVTAGDIHLNGVAYIDGEAHIGSNAFVCGTLKSTEVIVQTGWCDYVFEKDYELMSLGELRNYLDENKHLPNIPAASEVESEGMKVGEMNKAMMEKIEEMYLYILQLETRINDLEE